MTLFLAALIAASNLGTPVTPSAEQVCAQHRSNYFADLDKAVVLMRKAAAADYHWPDMKAAKALLDQAVIEAQRYRSCWKQGTQEPYDNIDHD